MNIYCVFAQVQWGEILPFVFGALVFMIPIIAIVLDHQRKMAELGLRQRSMQLDERQASGDVSNEVRELRAVLQEHLLQIDDRVESLSRRISDLEERSLKH